ncbi:putative selenate ABC transporter substrate-binding protein [Opitutales bacterium ASA1]|uniref:phosphate/phosphite/phosphonate ABC transporter substrate-binding protein n=1 Tax=Congregicoccus parvus TaxID=3081749 RepID=UPI002B2EBCF0|nr:putative selenate ABC transporter substrate-binding protein [Opitutales bacterium ASA1]
MNHARRRFLRLVPPALTTLGFGWSACGIRSADASDSPQRFRIASVPQQDMEERYAAAYRALEAYLAPRLGVPVSVHPLENATLALEGLRAGKLDLCNFSPWPFLLAESRANVEALLFTRTPEGGTGSYRSLLVTHRGTGLANAEDVLERAAEITFSFEEAVSTSGHLAPRAFFHQIGIDPEKDFKRVLFSTDGTTNLLAVKARRLDLAAVSDSTLRRAVDRGRISPDDIVVVWRSEPLLSGITAIRRALPAAFRRRVQTLFIDLPTAEPALWAEVARQYSHPVAGYSAADESLLLPYRRLVGTVPGLALSA